MKKLSALFQRHAAALGYVLTVILPVILRTGKRPVIFSKYSGIGDIICTFPTVLKLKARHPRATFIYNCHRAYACLPVMGGVTGMVTHLNHAGTLHYWYGWLFAAFYEFPCADELANDFCKKYVVMEYAADHGVTVPPAHPHLNISPAARERIKEKLKDRIEPNLPRIIIQTGPTWPIREWPQSAWAALVMELKKNCEAMVIQIGTNNHLTVGTTEVPELPGVVSMVNQFTLEESCAVIATSQLFIGIDSGLLHVAAALRIPCVGIFGPTSPQLRLPDNDVQNCVVSRIECQGCHHRTPRIHWETGCPHDAACMKNIQVAGVLEVCLQSILPRAGSSSK